MLKIKTAFYIIIQFIALVIISCSSQEYTTAKLAIQQSDFTKAAEWLPKAMEIEPNNPEIPLVLAIEIFAKNSEWSDMKKMFDRSMGIDPEKVIELRGSFLSVKEAVDNYTDFYWAKEFNAGVEQFKKIVHSNQFNYEKYDFNFHDLITLASIVQGEARDINEMSTISSVFHNRLNKNMYLDANATIQYIIPGENRRLRNKDLEINNRYNTYKYKGLPPGPINNPGLDAIIAASKPLTTDFLYFVKDPENLGKHVFNKTFKDHEKARKKYLKDLRINGFK